jgi:hypothetical protein
VSPVQGEANRLLTAARWVEPVLKINPTETHYVESNKVGMISRAGDMSAVSYSGLHCSLK